LRSFLATIVAVGKVVRITYSECACVDLGIRRAMRVRHSYSSPTKFSTLSYKWYDFLKTVIEQKIRVLIFSTTFV